MAANLTVSRSTSFFTDNDEQGVYDVGDTLLTRVTIKNVGDANATNVTFQDSFAGTTLVNGKLNISPIAFNDSFTAVANTVLRVGGAATINGGESITVAGNLLSNDRGSSTLGTGVIVGDSIPGFTIDAVSNGVTGKGGTFNIFADGSFNYVNDGNDTQADLTGGDSFTYTIRDAGLDGIAGNDDDLTSTATVRITFSTQSGAPGTDVNRVFYVDGSKNTDGTGTSANPFQSSQIATKLNGASDVDEAGHVIYVKNTASGSLTLEASQKLIGTGEELAVGGFQITPDGGSNSALNATSGFAVTLSTNNTIAGINLGGTGGITGTSFGTLTVTDDVVLNTSGTALSLTTGTFAGSGFASTTSTGGVNNVALTGVAGTVNLGGGALSGATGTTATGGNLMISGGTASVNYSGTIGQATAGVAAVNVTGNHSAGTVALSGNITATGGTGLQFSDADGTYTLSGVVSLTGTGDAGIDIVGGSGGTFTFGSLANQATVTNNSGSDAFVVSGSSATVTYNGAITDNNGNAVNILNNTGGTITFQNGTINSTNGGIDVTLNTGGTVNFNGQVTLNTGANTGVSLASNTGATINFTGGLDVVTTAGTAFTASGGGTVAVTGAGNTIASGTGSALVVQNTNIGLAGLTFESINTTTASSSSAINLTSTGTTAGVHGGLTITGTDGADAGTMADSGTGGTISNKSVDSIVLTSTRGVVLNGVTVTNNTGGSWIDADQVVGLTLNNFNGNNSFDDGIEGTNITNLVINGGKYEGGGTLNSVANFDGINITNLLGTSSITGATFERANTRQIYIVNNQATNFAGAADQLTVSGNTFQNHSVSPFHGDHLSVSADTGGNFRLVVDNSSGINLFRTAGIAVQATGAGSGKMDANISHITSGGTLASGFNNTSAVVIAGTGTSTVKFNVSNNTSLGTGSVAMSFNDFTSGSYSGTISGNTITHIAGTGTDAVQILSHGNANGTLTADGIATVAVLNNFIEGNFQRGIRAQAAFDQTTLNLNISGNTVHGTDPTPPASGGLALRAIEVEVGGSGGTTTDKIFLNLEGNNAWMDNGNAGYRLLHRGTGTFTFSLEDFTGSGTSATDIHNWIDNVKANNSNGGPATTLISGTTSVYTSHTTTPAPIMAEAPPPAAPASSEQEEQPVDGGLVDTGTVDNGDTGSQTNDQYGEPVPADDGDTGPIVVDDGVLSQAELNLIVEAAIQRWIAAGATDEQVAAMRAVNVSVSDLGGLTLGESSVGAITLDSDAAGWRWFIDATPGDDSEFAGSGTKLSAVDKTGLAGTRIDLLTVVTHELGHQIGLSDTYAPGETDELMYGTIGAGERRLPGSDDLSYAADGPVTGAFAFAPISLGTLEPGQTVVIEWHHTVDAPGEDMLVGSWTGQSLVDSTETDPELSGAESGNVDSLTLGDLIYLDVNANGVFDAGDSGIANVTLTLYGDTNNNGVYDAGVDLYVGYNEVNGVPGYQQGIDTPAAPGTGTALTASTDANGIYSFASLAPGDYLVVVDATNFESGGALFGKVSHGNPADPNAAPAVDGDNNGEQFLTGQAGTYAASLAIRLDYGQEPGGDVNNTLDLGFDQPNQAPTIANLQGNSATFTEGDVLVRIDAGGDALVADADSANFNGGKLTVSISAGKDAAEDQLAIDQSGTGVTIAGGVVSVDGVPIGTLSSAGGSGGGDLVVDFNTDDATPAAVQKLVRALAYFNTDTNGPSAAARTVSVTLVDGDGRANGGDDDVTVTTTVNVVPVNDAPSGADNEKVINEDATYTFVYVPGGTNDFGFSDTDLHSFAGIRVVTLPALGTLTLNGAPVVANAVISASDIQQGLLKYTPGQDGNGNDYASFTFAVIDSGLGTAPDVNEDPTPNTFTFDVTAQNDAPVLDLNGAAAGENGSGIVVEQDAAATGTIAPSATVTDVDSANFDTGTLSVSITQNAQAGDVVSVRNYTDGGSNSVTVSGSEISYNGTVVATFTAGDHDTPLVITFDADATPAAAQFVTRAVYFAHSGDAPSNAARTLTYTLTDGDGGSDSATASVTVIPANDAPDLTEPTAATIGYTEGAAAVKLMQGVTLTDPDQPANFFGGSLTVSVSGVGGGVNIDLNSSFKINDNGNGTFSLAYQDGPTQIAIGTISGFGTPTLTVSNFAVGATPARLNELVVAFTYVNLNDNPGTADRTVTMTFNDGKNTGSIFDEALTDTVTQTLQITPVNDAPSVDANGAAAGNGTATYTENGTLAPLAPALTVSDPDDTMIEGATVTIIDRAAGDELSIGGFQASTTGTNGAISFQYVASTGTLTLTGSATKADYEAALRQVSFSSTSNAPGTSRSISFTINDGEFQSNATNVDLTINQVNDAPTSANDSITTSEDDAYTFTAADFPFSDLDGNTLSAVRITSLPTGGTLIYDGDPVSEGQVISIGDINDGFLTYTPNIDQIGSPYDSFKFKVIDDGGTANGGANESGEQTMTVNVTPDNLAPTVDLNSNTAGVDYFEGTYTEGGAGAAIGSGITVTDADSGNGDLIEGATVTIDDAQTGDQLTVSGTLPAGITVDPTSTSTVLKLTGAASQADYQAALALVRYSHTGDDPTLGQTDLQRTIVVTVTDGAATSAPASATISITAVNDGPTNTVPATLQNVTEDRNHVFSTATGNAITVSDPDAESAQHDMTVTVSVLNGRLTLATQAGLTSVSNDGTASVTLTGTAAEINAALNGLVYRGNLNFEGDDTLTILTSDNGWSGTGGAKTDQDQVQIKVADDGFINGDSGNNVLNGTPQRDVFLVQQGGNDTVNGLAGNDTFYFGAAFTAADTVNGGGGPDVLVLQGDYSAGVTLGTGTTSNITSVESISLFSGSITLYGDTSGASYSYNLTTIDSNVEAGEFLRVNGFALLAGENFTFNGSAETDGLFKLLGGKGVDTLTGGANGDNFIFGHDGRFGAGDVVTGGGGYDVVYLRGNYTIDFNDVGFAGSLVGIESVALLSFTDTTQVSGGTGPFNYDIEWNDSMLGAGQTITFNGSRLTENETLIFDGGDETNGQFRIWGGAADDQIEGGAGADLITGGRGADLLEGGGGADTFRYAAVEESTSASKDQILDFEHNVDKIDLQRIDAKSFSGGDQAFTFIGAAAFSGSGNSSAGQLRAFQVDAATNLWRVEGDVDGDAVADLVIDVYVEAGQPLTVGDFML